MKPSLVIRHTNAQSILSTDLLAQEEPLIIDIEYGPLHNRTRQRLTTTMRTPGNDVELAIGLLFSLGIVTSMTDIIDITPCQRKVLLQEESALLTVQLTHTTTFSPHSFSFGHARYSSCGICGSHELPATAKIFATTFSLKAATLIALPEKMRAHQTIFHHTGGVHAAALFDQKQNLLALFEDVGRHNALDKLIGHALATGRLNLSECILLLSSRASYEIIQKAASAQIPVVAVMGAVSTLAVSEALKSNISLIGFLRTERLNVYTHEQRITE